jgi:hypothetical protein
MSGMVPTITVNLPFQKKMYGRIWNENERNS